jgi:hypothetical protein
VGKRRAAHQAHLRFETTKVRCEEQLDTGEAMHLT